MLVGVMLWEAVIEGVGDAVVLIVAPMYLLTMYRTRRLPASARYTAPVTGSIATLLTLESRA